MLAFILNGNQHLSDWSLGTYNRREIILNTGNLDKDPELTKSYILGENLLLPLY